MKNLTFKPWKVLETRNIFSDEPWIRLDVQKIKLPDGRIIENYYQIKARDFAVIFARTVKGEIIMERQYRHGVGKVTYTLPAGAIEPGEEPLVTAKRELLEETGYTGDEWQSLGSFIASVNYGISTAHIFVANRAQRVAEPDSGDLEETELIRMKPEEVIGLVRHGEIPAMSSVIAISLALNPAFAAT